MRHRKIALLAACALALGACIDLTVPDYNNPSIEEIRDNPTPASVVAAAQGLLVGTRVELADRNGYIVLLGILGREAYNFDQADPRFRAEMVTGILNPSSPAFGGNLWNDRYANMRNAKIVLDATEKVEGLTAEQKEGIRGFAKTIMALDLLKVVNTRDVNGAVIDIPEDPTAKPGSLVSKAEALNRVVSLLEEAKTHLEAAGNDFVFDVTEGFADFATPAAFLEFNRALKARVDVYMQNYDAALTSLGASFLDPALPLEFGAYHTFGTGSGDTPNTLYDPAARPTIAAHPSIRADAELKADGTPDDRVLAKTRITASQTVDDLTTNLAFTIYNSNNAPVPEIRNEELILLRAEARWFTGDRPGAVADLNFIRENSGGLDPIDPATIEEDVAFVTELLKQRRYSLLFEGHRWIDMRRFDRLDQLPRDRPNDEVAAAFPIPEAECLGQGRTTPCRAGG